MVVRCGNHWPPSNTKKEYIAELEPEGYPNNAVVLCGYDDCRDAGKMYLNEKEFKKNKHDKEVVFLAENDCLIVGKSNQANLLQGKSSPQNQTGLDDF